MPKHPVQTRASLFSPQTEPFALSFMLLAAAGCSSSTGAANAPDAGAASIVTDAGSDQLVGTFTVALIAPSASDPAGHTSIVGKVYDGPTPTSLVWQTVLEAGDCRLLKPRVPFCTEACGGSALCVEDDTCQPYPTAHEVGSVQVRGVKTATGATTFSMNPIAKAYQPTADVKLPFPAFAEGDAIDLSATGGDFAQFTLAAHGVAPLELSASDLALTRGKALPVIWTAASRADAASVHVKLDISHHGGSKGMIECDTDDAGALDVASELIDALLDLGVAGYPTIIVTRHNDGSTRIAAGSVKLAVSSQVEKEVLVPGLTSCTGDEDCPSGKTCQADLSCK